MRNLSVAAFAIIAITACAAPSEGTQTNEGTQMNESNTSIVSKGYVKPGASVDYSHNLASQVQPNSQVNFNLNITEGYTEGVMDVELIGEGLEVLNFSGPTSFDLSQGREHLVGVSVQTGIEGRQYVNVHARVTAGNGQVSDRIFSIPVQVGDVTARKQHQGLKTTTDGESVIIMQAEEDNGE